MAMKTVLSMIAVLSCVATLSARAGDFPPPARPDNTKPPYLDEIGIDQHLAAQVPLDVEFIDESGAPVRFGDVMKGRPVVLSLVYYGCPTLCTVVLNDQMRSFSALPLVMGKDYDVISVSFDPRETHDLASRKKREYVRKFARDGAAEPWRFLTGREESIGALTGAVGFRYKWDPTSEQYVHPGGLIILSADGRISKYFFGVDYGVKDLRLALVDAGEGKVGKLSDQIMLYCFEYDPRTGKYGWAVMRALRIGGVLFLVGLFGGIWWMVRKEKAEGRRQKAEVAI
jgi:protein SCO1/2